MVKQENLSEQEASDRLECQICSRQMATVDSKLLCPNCEEAIDKAEADGVKGGIKDLAAYSDLWREQ